MAYIEKRKGHFRITEAYTNGGKMIISPLIRAFGLVALLLANTVLANENSPTYQAIVQVVEQDFKNQVKRQANARHWGMHSLDFQVRVPASANHLPPCPEPLTVTGSDNKALPVGTLKRSVSCLSTTVDWRINITIKAELGLNLVVTNTGIRRQQTIAAKDLKLEWRTLSREQDFLTQVSEATGKLALRRIRSGQILNPQQLESPPLVEKGNQVIVTASKNGFTATTKGVALEQGTLGQQIDIKNLSSEKEIKAIVTGLNQVETQF
ncbi:flagellar basal body P-ring formation chaperone FlgA [Vibrio pectenicida]|uniref:Flagella basal body P-ring formation protein FlgA n=1 Tax=Vibrio pectenicida TaxID=62763 RepID=A0A3R9E2Q9_9VIBR|nr:flagellar basal body P-ring formation chaperone FlgA [Vibrio pectenicida]RSD32944.1 flagellar basal body P-ring formation protein FlgA [Vibrio pectenicida]